MKHASRAEDAPFQRFDRLFREIIAVPKSAVVKEEAKPKRRKKPTRRARSA